MPAGATAVFSRVRDLQDYAGGVTAGRFLRYDAATDTYTLQDFTVSGQANDLLKIDHQYVDASFPAPSAAFPDYSPLSLAHTNLAATANILSTFDLIYTGLRSHIQYGSSSVRARGTEHTETLTFDVQGSADGNNEVSLLMGWMRAKPASGTAAHGVASMWFTDWSCHGNIGAQSALLNGITMLLNSYDAASPVRGPSGACWLVTHPGQGSGREDGHDVAPTYPLDFILGIMGWAGTVDEVTQRPGAGAAIGIGEWGSGWGLIQDDDMSWFTHGISIRGGETSALRIRDPHASAGATYVGSAILFDTVAGITPTRTWAWWMDAGTAAAPTSGAIRLHGTNGATAGRVQWGSSNAPALYRSANDVIRWEGAGIIAPAAIAAGTTSTAHLYVRHDTNLELATFENPFGPAAVLFKLGDNTAGAGLRLWPGINADAINTLVGTSGVIMRGRYWNGASSQDRDASWRIGMLTTAPTFAMIANLNGVDALWLDQAGNVSVGTANLTTGRFNVGVQDSATTTATIGASYNHRTDGTPGGGFGLEHRWLLQSSTTPDQDAASVRVTWSTATHATRKALMTLSVYDTASREGIRIATNGAAPLLGFFNTVAVAQQSSGSTATDLASAIARVNQLATALTNLGLVA